MRRLPTPAGLKRRQAEDPRRRFEALLRRDFATLDPAVVEGFFANFGFAMPLSLVQQLVELVRARRPLLTVEVGSGISTVAVNGALAEHSGYLVSIEQDERYAFQTLRALTRPDRVALVCAAGEPGELAELARGWRPGLVVIDGPAGGRRFEGPWLGLYRSLLSPDCVCAVDDTDRTDNDAAAALLADENGLRKRDFGDPMYPGHRYSILLPTGVEPPPSGAVPLHDDLS